LSIVTIFETSSLSVSRSY